MNNSESNPKPMNELTSSFLAEKANFGTWIWYSVDDRMLFSEGFCRMLGITKNVYPTFELLVDRIQNDDLISFLDNISIIMNNSKPRWMRFRVKRTDNTIVSIYCYAEAIMS